MPIDRTAREARQSGTPQPFQIDRDRAVLFFHRHKRGFQVLWCSTDRVVLLYRQLLQQFQKLASRNVHEHILIFTSEEQRKQVRQWCVCLPDGLKSRHRERPFFSADPPRPLLDQLGKLQFTLQEEETITGSTSTTPTRLRSGLSTCSTRRGGWISRGPAGERNGGRSVLTLPFGR